MGPELSRAPISLGLYFFVLKIFFPQGRMQDLPNGGGGRRSKHWPPGAGDPRYATAQTIAYFHRMVYMEYFLITDDDIEYFLSFFSLICTERT